MAGIQTLASSSSTYPIAFQELQESQWPNSSQLLVKLSMSEELLVITIQGSRNLLSMLERNMPQHNREGEREGVEEGATHGRGMRTHQESGIYLRPVKGARRKRKIHFYDISFCNTEYINYRGYRWDLISLACLHAFKKIEWKRCHFKLNLFLEFMSHLWGYCSRVLILARRIGSAFLTDLKAKIVLVVTPYLFLLRKS